MLALVMNLGFAGGGGTVSSVTTKGGFSSERLTKQEKARLTRLKYQQSRLKDDEEALAIILATMLRRN